MLGVCYYPEHWDESRWRTDARRMRELGISFVRIGEFAWSRLEPSRGNFTFEWLDRAIDVQVSRLRKLVEDDPAKPRYIQTVWGFGYVFVPDDSKLAASE